MGAGAPGAWKRRLYWAAGVFAVGASLTGCAPESKADATAACEHVALLRGDGSELVDFTTEHVSGNVYKVTGTVVTPGLPDESFTGYADKEDGEYVCSIDL